MYRVTGVYADVFMYTAVGLQLTVIAVNSEQMGG